MNPENPQMQDILDIASNVHSPWPERIEMLTWVGLCLLFIFVVAASIALFKKWSRAIKRKKMPADEFAKYELNYLKSEQHLPIDVLYLKLTHIFKVYVSQFLSVDIFDKTLPEISKQREALESFFPDDKLDLIFELLQRSEGIKFAKASTTFENLLQDISHIEKWIESSATIKKSKENR